VQSECAGARHPGFTEDNSEGLREQAKRTKVKFQPENNSLGYLRFLLLARIRQGRCRRPQALRASQSFALHDEAINGCSTLLSFFRHSSLPAVAGHSCFVISFSCVIRGFKIKLSRKY
jgi:hypothetical protein